MITLAGVGAVSSFKTVCGFHIEINSYGFALKFCAPFYTVSYDTAGLTRDSSRKKILQQPLCAFSLMGALQVFFFLLLPFSLSEDPMLIIETTEMLHP